VRATHATLHGGPLAGQLGELDWAGKDEPPLTLAFTPWSDAPNVKAVYRRETETRKVAVNDHAGKRHTKTAITYVYSPLLSPELERLVAVADAEASAEVAAKQAKGAAILGPDGKPIMYRETM
jgi:hypothetical protein